MEDFLEKLREALKENPNLVLDIPLKVERLSTEELEKLFCENQSNDEDEIEVSE